jgi:hypothetical protein
MNLSDEKVSEAIAAVMGVCWHEMKSSGWKNDQYLCAKCEKFYTAQFSAFTPDGIFAWKSYMEKEMAKVWDDYIFSYMTEPIVKVVDGTLPISSIKPNRERLNDMLNPSNLVRYLYDNLDSWGYEECEHYAVNCGGSNACKAGFIYPECDNGKVLTEKARKFKAIIVGEGE